MFGKGKKHRSFGEAGLGEEIDPGSWAPDAPQAHYVRSAVEAMDRGKWVDIYGDFVRPNDFQEESITGLDKESGWIRREIVHFVNRLAEEKAVAPLFLPGEYRRVVPVYCQWLGIDAKSIVTAGLGDDVDVPWNFEDDPPAPIGPFALIISQAMIEHLVDPYKHLKDLFSMLDAGGSMIIHTVTPGFDYHRFPIDCQRFFPDWFEEVARRLGATVTGRFVGDLRILYQFSR